MPNQDHPQKPLRIALVITELDVGGAEQCLANLALGLDPNRFAPQVYALDARPRAGQDDLVLRLEQGGIDVHFVEATSKTKFLYAIGKLKQLLTKQSPHLVQTFLFHANVVGCLAAKRAKVPEIVTNIRVADPSKCRQQLERWLTRRSKKIVCVSDSVARFCHEEARFPQEKLVTIPNGIDVKRFETQQQTSLAELEIPGHSEVILFVGRFARQKGVDWLVSVMPGLFDRLHDVHLLLVGEGSDRPSIERRVQQAGLAKRIHFAGQRNDIAAIMNRCRLLVLPSRWEGMPNVLIEAMTMKMPVLAASSHGVREVLGPLSPGQTFDFGDQATFVEQAHELLDDAELAMSLGAQNRQRIERNFTIDRMVQSYEQLYLSLFPAE